MQPAVVPFQIREHDLKVRKNGRDRIADSSIDSIRARPTLPKRHAQRAERYKILASKNGNARMGNERIEGDRYEVAVSGNGDTLWVNGDDGLCWARFSKRFGIDVHRSSAMPESARECLYCTHSKAGITDWEIFRAEVFRHHRVVIDADALLFD